jgi:DNA-binding NarL/FixJ family response regulator
MSADPRTRLLLVDNHDRVRRGVRGLLAHLTDFEIVGEAADGHEAVRRAAELRPDLVLMDVSMPVIDGIEATRRILTRDPRIRVVIMTVSRGRERDAYRAGAAAHILKDADPGELIRCLRQLSAPTVDYGRRSV